jgi:hypothetical protein
MHKLKRDAQLPSGTTHSAWSTSTTSPLASVQPAKILYQFGGDAVALLLTMTSTRLTIAQATKCLLDYETLGGLCLNHATLRGDWHHE